MIAPLFDAFESPILAPLDASLDTPIHAPIHAPLDTPVNSLFGTSVTPAKLALLPVSATVIGALIGTALRRPIVKRSLLGLCHASKTHRQGKHRGPD